ncbi:hypothetical protein M513_14015, partial [Trichuris suis]
CRKRDELRFGLSDVLDKSSAQKSSLPTLPKAFRLMGPAHQMLTKRAKQTNKEVLVKTLKVQIKSNANHCRNGPIMLTHIPERLEDLQDLNQPAILIGNEKGESLIS